MSDKEDAVYVPVDRIAFRKIGDHCVLVHTVDSKLVKLNETGSAIWEMLDGRSVSDLAKGLSEGFDVEPSTARTDVVEFLGYMEGRGFVCEKKE